MEIPKPGERYAHFKGQDRIYEVVAVARDCENPQRQEVVYKQLYETSDFPNGTVWTRSLDDFVGEKEISPGKKIKRFTKIS